MDEDLIAKSTFESLIRAPLSSISLPEWVFTLTSSEYQACSKNHIAAAATFAPDGRRMSINVERVGNLMVQHYVEDLAREDDCRLVSLSDSIGPDIASSVKVVVVWSFATTAVDAATTRLTNSVEVRTTPEYLEALEKRGVSLAQAREYAQAALSAHNIEETPLFAKDIERKALAMRWSDQRGDRNV